VVRTLNLEQKKQVSDEFIKSHRFTSATFGVLIIFRENVARMINLIELHKIFLDRIEAGNVKHSFPDEELIKIKHLILMDSLSKIMIVIESLLNLFDCFSRFPYQDIPRQMVRYPIVRINGFVKRFQERKISLWRIAGFPKVKSLVCNCGLARNEAELIHSIFKDSCEQMRKTLGDIIGFYQSNKILYGKSKHGLIFMPGFSFSGSAAQEAPKSFLIAFDKLGEKPSILCFEGREIAPEGLEWFNTYSLLPCWENTFKRYSEILSLTKRTCDYVINNHLLWALNCGEDYLPMKRNPDGEQVIEIHISKELSGEDNRRFSAICQKVAKNTHFREPKLNVIFNFSPEKSQKILNCFKENQSATIWKSERIEK